MKEWFEIFPEKVVFGSDCFPASKEIAAPETYWLAIQTARSAVAAALADMVSEGEITEARAMEIARDYFHDTTARLFGWHRASTGGGRPLDFRRGRKLSKERHARPMSPRLFRLDRAGSLAAGLAIIVIQILSLPYRKELRSIQPRR